MANAFQAIVLLALLSLLSGTVDARRRRRANPRDISTIEGICPVSKQKGGCATPDFAGPGFGDNTKTTGVMHTTSTRKGVKLQITVENLPKPNLVLTAWVVWVPAGVTIPKIFEVRNIIFMPNTETLDYIYTNYDYSAYV